MTLEIRTLTLGPVQTNAYILADTVSGDAIVIDPVDNAQVLLKTVADAGWTIKLILATHAHFDHVMASQPLKEATGAPFWLHEDGLDLLAGAPEQMATFTGRPGITTAQPDHFIRDEEEIVVGSIRLRALYTPGHAPGHLSFYLPEGKLVFSGDSLFAGSIGRTDLKGVNLDLLMDSIFSKLMVLDDETRVLPGHMHMTTIGNERLSNPFLLSYKRQSK